ncbi:protein yippee-like 2 isoform X1 [Hemiscyllium ocellatum]|uniref:protein yippee-like 2 isoform X1 n=1 Tax=Hemiscyllium ocellatum TaxID=170820 RepID=UPI0029668EF1|nr:protein yippee-like 2 isoform X1 [Hemiscyllium ocellatum]
MQRVGCRPAVTWLNIFFLDQYCPCLITEMAVNSQPHCSGFGITCRSDQSFQGSQGRAYLFNSVVNVGCGPAEERVLLTGLHAVADIYCENCKTTLGWKYEHAFESSQKYKEGKYIIELAHMIKDNGWE